MSHSCRILALLMLDTCHPEGSGRQLIEWAAVCGADGVIVPWWPQGEPEIAERLVAQARHAALGCYLQLQPNGPMPTSSGVDGYWISDPDAWSLKTLQGLRPQTFLCIGNAAQLESYLPLREASFVYVDGDQPSGAWFPVWQRLSRQGRRRALGYLDEHPGFIDAIEQTSHAPFMVKRLALTRHGMGPASSAALLPYEFSQLVRVARGIRQQLAMVTGKPSVSLQAAVSPRRPRLECGSADIAVVIRSKNEAEWIGRTLERIAGQSRQPHEVILVDNESTDETVEIARRFGRRLPLKIVTILDSEFTFSRALNRGLEQVTASWAISLSAHCIPVNASWLTAFEDETLDVGLAPFLAGVYGRQEPLEGVTSDFDKRDLWTTFGAGRRVQQDQDFFFHNANSMIRKVVWEHVPFDETLNGVEDRDWAQKVLREGYSLVYAPQARVSHHHGIHHGRNASRARRVAQVIELIQQRVPAESLSGVLQ